ncbi:MAG: hypothetical protein OXG82_05540 [Gammaproteobacteria bacterium]|nr:hypothetical protein [Gammaproteobacteria bacterium]
MANGFEDALRRTGPPGLGQAGRGPGTRRTAFPSPSRTRTAEQRAGPAVAGSATVEFCVIAPFILVLLAAVWDLRAYIAQRTDLVREIYVMAEAMADEIDDATAPFASVLGADGPFRERLGGTVVAGAASAALVVRGTTHRDGTACAADAWCPPTVALAWPASESDRVWRESGAAGCSAPNALPAPGTSFPAAAAVLPGESADGTPEETWFSRNMSDQEWWVVIDVCIRPRGGIGGRMTQLAAAAVLDLPFDIRHRAAWPSVHDRDDCPWCSSGP